MKTPRKGYMKRAIGEIMGDIRILLDDPKASIVIVAKSKAIPALTRRPGRPRKDVRLVDIGAWGPGVTETVALLTHARDVVIARHPEVIL